MYLDWPPKLSSLRPRTPRWRAAGVALLLYVLLPLAIPARPPAPAAPPPPVTRSAITAHRLVPVEVLVMGAPAPGHFVGQPSVRSGPVRVGGPGMHRVARVRALLRLTGLESRPFTCPVAHLVAVDREGRPCAGVEVRPVSVHVRIPVQGLP